MTQAKHVLIVEDHELLSQGVSLALKAAGYGVTVASEPSLDGIARLAADIAPDLVLLDLELGEIGSGREVIGRIRAAGAAVLMLTGVTDEAELGACVEAGAVGVVSKASPFDALLHAIDAAIEGGVGFQSSDRERWLDALHRQRERVSSELQPFRTLSRRESETLALLMEGLAAERIAEDTFVSLATVRSHIRAILQKLGVKSQLAAVALARRSGWTVDLASGRE